MLLVYHAKGMTTVVTMTASFGIAFTQSQVLCGQSAFAYQ